MPLTPLRSVWDGVGDLLLIALPRWARKPEATLHRSFIARGELRLLKPARGDGAWTLARGLACAGAPTDVVRARLTLAPAAPCDAQSEAETAALRARLAAALAGFPGRAAAQRHVAHATVAARVALLLREEPQLVVRAPHVPPSR